MAEGKPFATPHRDRFLLLVSTPEQIEELAVESTRKHSKLSSQGIMVDTLNPEFTLNAKKEDPAGFIAPNLLKHKIRKHLSSMYLPMRWTVEDAFRKEMKGKPLGDGWSRVPLCYVANRITARMNNLLLVGENLASNPTFFESSIQFVTDATITLAFFNHIPKILYRPISFMTMNWSGGRSKAKSLLMSEISKRRSESSEEQGLYKDCMQWVIESSRDKSTEYIARQLLSLTLGGAHQQPMFAAFVLYNLCLHSEYIETLRAEIHTIRDNEFDKLNNGTPYLDSFLREVGRLNPLTNIALPRKVMSPFTFADGTYVPKHNWICVPHTPLMTLPNAYSNPETFQGFRFVDTEGNRSTSRFWDMSREFPFWGNPKTGCPARYFVSLNMKMMAIHFLESYDFRVAKQAIRPTFSYHVLEMPHPLLAIEIRARKPEA
ncbi:uncharacterized protein BP5553_02747 [Venustampulla echinocandica]|uniref:Cytochrome P450 n=1 Tax=Venustampulla echinocandica TaxID=2656787 RepID=A0A370TSA1_9HELO|nr:uncharacterized protein BP5553_02747 [Venustampulla echinocandica]RDL38407.1 hypothetical protein BP5553_02747 [Venustampulla echinocandica]